MRLPCYSHLLSTELVRRGHIAQPLYPLSQLNFDTQKRRRV